MKKLLLNLCLSILLVGLVSFTTALGQTWTYDFGSTDASHTSGVSTSFFPSTPTDGGTYRVRVGTQGGGFHLETDGGTDAELQINAAYGGSTNKFTVYDWDNPSNLAYVKFQLKTRSSGDGIIAFHLGDGTSAVFTGNLAYNSYNTSLTTFWIEYDNGAIDVVRRRDETSNETITGHGFLSDTEQVIEIFGNNGSTSTTYEKNSTTYTLNSQSWDLWVDGTKISPANGWGHAGSTPSGDLAGIGFFAQGSTDNNAWAHIDDLEYSNALPGIVLKDEPSEHAANLSATAQSHNTILVEWSDAGGTTLPDAYLVKAAIHPATPSAPADGTVEADALLVKNIAYGTEEAVFTGLEAETIYNFAIWPYTNSGSDIDYKTDGVVPSASATTDIAPIYLIDENIQSWTEQIYGDYTETIDVGSSTGIVDMIDARIRPTDPGVDVCSQGFVQIRDTEPSIIDLPEVPSVSTITLGLVAFAEGRDLDIQVFDGTDWNTVHTFTGIGLTGKMYSYNIDSPTPTQIRITNPSHALKVHDIKVAAYNMHYSDPSTTIADTESYTFGHVYVEPGAHLEIESGGSLKAYGNFTILSDDTGTGSLIDNGTLDVDGEITVQKFLPNSTTTGWYIGAPVTTYNFDNFDDADGFYEYLTDTDGNGYWSNLKNTVGATVPAVGYVTRFSNVGNYTLNFEGTLNSGVVANNNLVRTTTTLPGDNYGWNLVSNPYPSPIDWLSGSITKTNLNAAVYYRTADGNVENYVDDSPGGSSAGGSRYIPAMQAFWVQVTMGEETGSIEFDNGARTNQGNNELLKTKGNAALHMFVERAGYTDESIIRFISGATELFDASFDAGKMFSLNNAHPQLFSVLSNNQNLAINSLPELTANTTVTKGFQTENAGEHTISVSGLSTFDSNIGIYLEDITEDTIVDLHQHNTYTFTAAAGSTTDRFLVHFVLLTTDMEDKLAQDDVHIYTNEKVIYITNAGDNASVSVFNLLGQEVYNAQLDNKILNAIPTNLSIGHYVVRVTGVNSHASEKVFIK